MTGQGKHALVTGGAGFIGAHLVRELLSRGYKVTVWDNLHTGRESNLAEVRADIDFAALDIRHVTVPMVRIGVVRMTVHERRVYVRM